MYQRFILTLSSCRASVWHPNKHRFWQETSLWCPEENGLSVGPRSWFPLKNSKHLKAMMKMLARHCDNSIWSVGPREGYFSVVNRHWESFFCNSFTSKVKNCSPVSKQKKNQQIWSQIWLTSRKFLVKTCHCERYLTAILEHVTFKKLLYLISFAWKP